MQSYQQTEDVWNNLKAKLSIPYFRAKAQGMDSVDWEREIMSFRQLVITGNTFFGHSSFSFRYVLLTN